MHRNFPENRDLKPGKVAIGSRKERPLSLDWALCTAGGDQRVLALLARVAELGTVRAAAAACGVSYRYARALLETAAEGIGQPLVATRRRDGARLTAAGERLVALYRRVEQRVAPALEGACAEIERELAALSGDRLPDRLRVVASHDFAVQLLVELAAGGGPQLELTHRGSLDALRALAAGEADVAGFHLPEGTLGRAVVARYRAALPAGARCLLLARREQGLMHRADVSPRLGGFGDLAARRLLFINRQPGSGTRVLFDQLLSAAGVAPRQIRGYDTAEFTHMAVAAMVASGGADCGFGLREAAQRFGLEFVPLAWERYWLAWDGGRDTGGRIAALRRLADSAALRARVQRLAGYDGAAAGEQRSPAALTR